MQAILCSAAIQGVMSTPCRCGRVCASKVKQSDIYTTRSAFWTANADKSKSSLHQARRQWLAGLITKASDFSENDRPTIKYRICNQFVCRHFFERALKISHQRLSTIIKYVKDNRSDGMR